MSAIYESASTLVHRSRRRDHDVIVKVLKDDSHNPNAIARYHHEFNVNQSLTSDFVCRALEYDDITPKIYFEDVEVGEHANQRDDRPPEPHPPPTLRGGVRSQRRPEPGPVHQVPTAPGRGDTNLRAPAASTHPHPKTVSSGSRR